VATLNGSPTLPANENKHDCHISEQWPKNVKRMEMSNNLGAVMDQNRRLLDSLPFLLDDGRTCRSLRLPGTKQDFQQSRNGQFGQFHASNWAIFAREKNADRPAAASLSAALSVIKVSLRFALSADGHSSDAFDAEKAAHRRMGEEEKKNKMSGRRAGNLRDFDTNEAAGKVLR
jgi:hypothetical protein